MCETGTEYSGVRGGVCDGYPYVRGDIEVALGNELVPPGDTTELPERGEGAEDRPGECSINKSSFLMWLLTRSIDRSEELEVTESGRL